MCLWIPYCEVGLKHSQKWLVTPLAVMLLMYQRAHLAWWVSSITCRVQHWVNLLIPFPSSALKVRRASWLFEADYYVVQSRCVASSAIGSYHLVIAGTQEQ